MNESKPVTRFEMQVYFKDGRGLMIADHLTELCEYILQWKDLIDYVRIVPIQIDGDIDINWSINQISKKSILK